MRAGGFSTRPPDRSRYCFLSRAGDTIVASRVAIAIHAARKNGSEPLKVLEEKSNMASVDRVILIGDLGKDPEMVICRAVMRLPISYRYDRK